MSENYEQVHNDQTVLNEIADFIRVPYYDDDEKSSERKEDNHLGNILNNEVKDMFDELPDEHSINPEENTDEELHDMLLPTSMTPFESFVDTFDMYDLEYYVPSHNPSIDRLANYRFTLDPIDEHFDPAHLYCVCDLDIKFQITAIQYHEYVKTINTCIARLIYMNEYLKEGCNISFLHNTMFHCIKDLNDISILTTLYYVRTEYMYMIIDILNEIMHKSKPLIDLKIVCKDKHIYFSDSYLINIQSLLMSAGTMELKCADCKQRLSNRGLHCHCETTDDKNEIKKCFMNIMDKERYQDEMKMYFPIFG